MSLFVVCAFVIAVCALFLVMDEKYEDGILGCAALLTLLIAEIIVIAEWWHEVTYIPQPTTVAVQYATAVFLSRHTYRFIRWRLSGVFEWRERKAVH